MISRSSSHYKEDVKMPQGQLVLVLEPCLKTWYYHNGDNQCDKMKPSIEQDIWYEQLALGLSQLSQRCGVLSFSYGKIVFPTRLNIHTFLLINIFTLSRIIFLFSNVFGVWMVQLDMTRIFSCRNVICIQHTNTAAAFVAFLIYCRLEKKESYTILLQLYLLKAHKIKFFSTNQPWVYF